MFIWSILKIVLIISLLLGIAALRYAVRLVDACFTVPCLPYELFTVNPLKVDQSASVAAVVNSSIMVLVPICGLYLAHLRLGDFSLGVLAGCCMLTALAACLQAVYWGDQYAKMMHLKHSNELLNYGSLKTHYHVDSEVMLETLYLALLFVMIVAIESIVFLILLYSRKAQSRESQRLALSTYQAIAMAESFHG